MSGKRRQVHATKGEKRDKQREIDGAREWKRGRKKVNVRERRRKHRGKIF